MNQSQTIGISERMLYAFLMWCAMKLVAGGYLDTQGAEYLVAGAFGAITGAYGWWTNRPKNLLNLAGQSLPANAKLAITATAAASMPEKIEVATLLRHTNDKVVSVAEAQAAAIPRNT